MTHHGGGAVIRRITTQFIRLLEEQVWGQGFAPPVFCDDFRVVNQRVLKEKHLQLLLDAERIALASAILFYITGP